jgi:hypothetical protein
MSRPSPPPSPRRQGAERRAMPSTDDDLRKLIEEEEQKMREDFARAIERGGLPTPDDVAAVFDDLNKVFDRLEEIGWRVKGITAVSGWKQEASADVDWRDLGVLAVMADDVEDRAGDFLGFAKTLRDAMPVLHCMLLDRGGPGEQVRLWACPRERH